MKTITNYVPAYGSVDVPLIVNNCVLPRTGTRQEQALNAHLSTLECESPAQFIQDWSFTGNAI